MFAIFIALLHVTICIAVALVRSFCAMNDVLIGILERKRPLLPLRIHIPPRIACIRHISLYAAVTVLLPLNLLLLLERAFSKIEKNLGAGLVEFLPVIF